MLLNPKFISHLKYHSESIQFILIRLGMLNPKFTLRKGKK